MTVYYTCEIEENELTVIFEGDITWENSGIGSYEYWGFKGYDKGEDYPVCEGISWDKSEFNQQENKIIEAYVRDHQAEIDKELEEKAMKEAQNYH